MPLGRNLARIPLTPWRVGFVVGGAMKGGTTALSSFLDQHPEIQMAKGKEAHFFDTDDNFPQGSSPDYERYHSHFEPATHTRTLGDATPVYLYWEPAPARIAAYNPRMKWVLLLRHPIERAYSHWNMNRQNGEETLPFLEAIAQEPRRRDTARDQRVYSYFSRGLYALQLRRLFAVFPRKQVLVLRSEELQREHDATLRRIFEFLEVDPNFRVAQAKIHAREYAQPLPAEDRRQLIARYAEDIADLEHLLSWDLSDWRAS